MLREISSHICAMTYSYHLHDLNELGLRESLYHACQSFSFLFIELSTAMATMFGVFICC